MNAKVEVAQYIGTSGFPTHLSFSPFGGQLAFGNLLDNPNASAPQSQDAAQSLVDEAVQIVVPDPSPERLQAIAAACDAPPQVVQAITSAANTQAPDGMSARVDTMDALPADAIPPGCAADLRAVAEAIGEASALGE